MHATLQNLELEGVHVILSTSTCHACTHSHACDPTMLCEAVVDVTVQAHSHIEPPPTHCAHVLPPLSIAFYLLCCSVAVLPGPFVTSLPQIVNKEPPLKLPFTVPPARYTYKSPQFATEIQTTAPTTMERRDSFGPAFSFTPRHNSTSQAFSYVRCVGGHHLPMGAGTHAPLRDCGLGDVLVGPRAADCPV
jgi:hypothetical protein